MFKGYTKKTEVNKMVRYRSKKDDNEPKKSLPKSTTKKRPPKKSQNRHKMDADTRAYQQEQLPKLPTKKEVKSTAEKVKSGASKQLNWLIRDIKSDFLPTEERRKVQDQIAKEKVADYQKKGGFANDKIGQFYTGFGESVVDNNPVGIAYGIATGKKLSESDVMRSNPSTGKKKKSVIDTTPTEEAATARKRGRQAGELLSYAGAYGAAGKATGKAASKVLATKAGKKATEKAVASKIGQNVGEEAAKGFVKAVTKDAVSDATVGTVMNLGRARGEGKAGGDLIKDMAINAALDFGIGGVMEAVPLAKMINEADLIKMTAKNAGKGAKSAVDNMQETAKNASKSTDVAPKIELPQKGAKQAENIKMEPPTVNGKKAGRVTYIKNPYNGETPQKTTLGSRKPVEISGKTMEDVSYIKSHAVTGSELKKQLKDNFGKARTVTVEGLHFSGKPYNVNINKNTIAKIVSDGSKDENIAFLSVVDDAMRNAEYVGSGSYIPHGSKKKNTVRFDYFESDVKINGEDYIARIDVEAFPDVNNYKTHNIEKIELIPKSSADTGIGPAANDMKSTPTPIVKDSLGNVNTNQPLKDLRKDNSPVTEYGFEVEGDTLGIVDPNFKTVTDAIENAEGKFRKFYTATVDSQSAINRLAKESGNRKVADSVQAARTSSGTTEYILTKKLVNPKGEVISDKSFKEVFEPVARNSEDFNTYAQHLNNIDRWKQGKPVFEQYSAEESQKIVNEMLQKHPEFAEMTKEINDYWQKFTHAWLVDTGRMTENAWQAMNKMYPNYVPAFRKNKGGVSVGGSHYSIGSGVKKAKGGHSETIPIEDAMMEQVQQMVKSTRKNDLYLDLINTLKNNPEQLKTFGVVAEKKPMQSLDIDSFLSEVDQNSLKEINSKVYTISAMDNGQKVTAYINKDIAEALGKLDNVVGSDEIRAFMNVGKTITNPLKAGITGYNPIFAVSNMARDIPTAIIQSEYGVGTTTKNMFNAIYQMATNGEMWQRYQALGGKSAGYINAHRGFDRSLNMSKNPTRRIWEGMKTVLGAFGEATESIPRLAEFISSMEKHGDLNRALNEAAEITVNFSRAGEVTKVLDGWTLYLNAAVQGIDKFVRTAKAHPARTAARSIGVVGVPYALLMAANWNNPHYQDLNERTKQNYFCIPNLAGEFDEEGNPMTFIKIPLNREYGTIFAASLDVVADYLSGKADPLKGYGETIQNNFLPPNPITDNVLAPLLLNLPQNKDFAGRSIVPTNLENVSPQLQYDYSTSGLAKGIANVANNLNLPSKTLKSPMKVDYLLDSFGGYLGEVGQAVTDPQLQGLKERVKGATIDPFINRFTADPRFSSGVISDFYDDKEEAERAYNDEKILKGENGESYIKNKTYTAIQKELSDLSKEEREILSSDLSKAEKNEQIKAIREQKNEIARGAGQRADEALSAYYEEPEYELLDKQQKQSYEKNYADLGVSKSEFAAAKKITKGIDSKVAQAYALLENGQSEKVATAMTSAKAVEEATDFKSKGFSFDEIQSAKEIIKESGYTKSVGKAYTLLDNGTDVDMATMMTSEKAVKRATWCKQAGITPEMLDEVASYIDTDKNGSYKVDEIKAFFNEYSGFTTAQKRAIFLALSTSENSPY